MPDMNWTDYVIVALLVFSSVAGLLRGLLREVPPLITCWSPWCWPGQYAHEL